MALLSTVKELALDKAADITVKVVLGASVVAVLFVVGFCWTRTGRA